MGPAATVDFYAKLTENTPVDRDQDHLRVVIWSDPTVPSRQEAILGDGADPTPWLQRGVDALVASGAEVLVVPCNTVRPFVTEIVPAGAEYIDIVDVTIEAVRRAATSKSVGVLATDATLAIGMYQSALTKAGFAPQVPDASAQQRVTAVVDRVKSIGADSIASENFVDVVDTLRASGIDTAIVGCTELSAVLAVCEPPPGLRLIDSARELATTAIAVARDDGRPSDAGTGA